MPKLIMVLAVMVMAASLAFAETPKKTREISCNEHTTKVFAGESVDIMCDKRVINIVNPIECFGGATPRSGVNDKLTTVWVSGSNPEGYCLIHRKGGKMTVPVDDP